MKLTEITFSNLKNQIENFLKTEYKKADMIFSNASPYGQILFVMENLNQLSLLYLKNSLKGLDLSNNNSKNENIIKNAAIFAGHIPGRAISATGTLKLTVKPGSDIEDNIPGGRMTLFNRTAIRNKTNGLEYSINIGSEKTTYKIDNNSVIYLPIIQGKWSVATFTGTGNSNQTFQVTMRDKKDVENFNFEVTVDGEFWETKSHIYDMLPDEKACVVRTGFNGGIDIIFGNGGFGLEPRIGSAIQVSYLVSDGAKGSIFRRTPNDWTFIDQATDGFGNILDPTSAFDIQIYTDINFGADKESIEFTRNVLPISSNNFVLGTPRQYAYNIKKLGVFSHVNAYESDGGIFIVATPNIKLFKNKNANYFNINISAFELDDYEKAKVNKYLKSGGNIILSKRYQIDSPILSYYVMNIFVITYSDAVDDVVNAQIYDTISEYFLNLTRIDRIPKADLVRSLSLLNDIHSVDISFVCKNNEDYHKQAKIDDENRRNEFASNDNISVEAFNPVYDPNRVIGIDNILGDIIFEPSQMPIIRGGWYDRNDVFFADGIDGNGLKSVNIIKKGTIDVKNKPKI